MDVFTSSDLQRLFHNKFVVIIGDSVQRGIYKDLVFLLQQNKYLAEHNLKKKCEMTFQGDELIEGGELGRLHNGKDMREVRQYRSDYHLLRFYYVTRCYSEYMETIFLDLKDDMTPDIVIMNSCLWDITRYGPRGFDNYQKNLQRLFTRLKDVLPESSLFLWLTTLPIGNHVRGGFMLEELSFYNETLRFDIVVSNFYAREVVVDYGHNILDLHHHFRELTHWRQPDGIHWNVYAHRRITQLILTFVCQSWNIRLPHRNRGWALKEYDAPQYDENMNQIKPKKGRYRSISCNDVHLQQLSSMFDMPTQSFKLDTLKSVVHRPLSQTNLLSVDYGSKEVNGFHDSNSGGGPTRRRRNNKKTPYNR